MAMMAAGNMKIIGWKSKSISPEAPVFEILIELKIETMVNTMGMMNIPISSLRRVNDLASLRIIAASTVVKPSFPSNPVLGM